MDDFACRDSTDWLMFLDGWEAARRGDPFEASKPGLWRRGYSVRLAAEKEAEPPRVVH